MARKVKCKICGNSNEIVDSYKVEKISPTSGKVTNLYYCSKDEHDTYFDEKNRLRELRSEAFTYIHDEILQYGEGILLPSVMVKRLDELSKAYVWQVIQGTFKYKREAIHYAMKTKNFNSEFVMSKYILAIIESSLNDVNVMWKRKLIRDSKEKQVTQNVNVDVYEEMTESVIVKREESSISQFLDEDD